MVEIQQTKSGRKYIQVDNKRVYLTEKLLKELRKLLRKKKFQKKKGKRVVPNRPLSNDPRISAAFSSDKYTPSANTRNVITKPRIEDLLRNYPIFSLLGAIQKENENKDTKESKEIMNELEKFRKIFTWILHLYL